MHPCPGTGCQSCVQSCVMTGLPTHLVQELNVGAVEIPENTSYSRLSLHFGGPVLMTVWSKVLPLTANCPTARVLIPLGHVRKLPATWGKVMVWLGTSVSCTNNNCLVTT